MKALIINLEKQKLFIQQFYSCVRIVVLVLIHWIFINSMNPIDANATTYYRKTGSTDWFDSCNWCTDPTRPNETDCSGVPGISDHAVINAHTGFTLTNDVVVGSLELLSGAIVGNYNFSVIGNCMLGAYGQISVTGDVWVGGHIIFEGGSINQSDTVFAEMSIQVNNGSFNQTVVMAYGGVNWNSYNFNFDYTDIYVTEGQSIFMDLSTNHTIGGTQGRIFLEGSINKQHFNTVSMATIIIAHHANIEILQGGIHYLGKMDLYDTEFNISDQAFWKMGPGTDRNFYEGSTINSEGILYWTGTLIDSTCHLFIDSLILQSGNNYFYKFLEVDHLVLQSGIYFNYGGLLVRQSCEWYGSYIYGDHSVNFLTKVYAFEGNRYCKVKLNFSSGMEWIDGAFHLSGASEFYFPMGTYFEIKTINDAAMAQFETSGGKLILDRAIMRKTENSEVILSVFVNMFQATVPILDGHLRIDRGYRIESSFENNATLEFFTNDTFRNSQIFGSGLTIFTTGNHYLFDHTRIFTDLLVTGGLHCWSDIHPGSLILNAGELWGDSAIIVDDMFTVDGNGSIIGGEGLLDVQGPSILKGSNKDILNRTVVLHGPCIYESGSLKIGGTGLLLRTNESSLRFVNTANAFITPSGSVHQFLNQGHLILDGSGNVTISCKWKNMGIVSGSGLLIINTANTINEGTLAPEALTIQGSIQNSTLEIETYYNGDVHADHLHVTGNLNLSGSILNISNPLCLPADTVEFLSWGGTLTGDFISSNLPGNASIFKNISLKKYFLVYHTPTSYYADADGDGYGDANESAEACSTPEGYVENADDCDDANSTVHPGASEVCNGVDDDCDGNTDEGVKNTYYIDADGDGYGNSNESAEACSTPEGYVENADDCDDANSTVHPGASELCNGVDDDCDGNTDEGVKNTYYIDADGDGYGNANESTEACSTPEGYVENADDCDDANTTVHPGASELCNGVDDDCDGNTDEGVRNTYYIDADGDGYGNANESTEACLAPEGYVENSDDCDDANTTVHPGASELCNGVDDDCDGNTDEDSCDEDSDGDGISDSEDNCVDVFNAGQEDIDGDGMGDVCDSSENLCMALETLIDEINESSVPGNLKNALNGKINKALEFFQDGNENASIGKLNAFINQVNDKRGTDIPAPLADLWIYIAQTLIEAIEANEADCGSGFGFADNRTRVQKISGDLVIPNPNEGSFRLDLNPGDEIIQIVHMTGQKVEFKISETQPGKCFVQIEKCLIANGMYYLCIQNEKGIRSRPFLILKQ